MSASPLMSSTPVWCTAGDRFVARFPRPLEPGPAQRGTGELCPQLPTAQAVITGTMPQNAHSSAPSTRLNCQHCCCHTTTATAARR